jgi:putative copper export protein
MILRRVASIFALLALAVWLGGLVALGAVAAPIVFSHVSWPQSADAMSLVFRRFDLLAMSCGVVVLVTEAARAFGGHPFARVDHVRALASLVAAAAAVYEGVSVSPRIAALHEAGAIRGAGVQGLELSHLHDIAEALGKTEVVLLAAVIVLQVIALTSPSAVGAEVREG